MKLKYGASTLAAVMVFAVMIGCMSCYPDFKLFKRNSTSRYLGRDGKAAEPV